MKSPMHTPAKGNPLRGSTCNPKGETVGIGTGRGRAAVALGKASAKKVKK